MACEPAPKAQSPGCGGLEGARARAWPDRDCAANSAGWQGWQAREPAYGESAAETPGANRDAASSRASIAGWGCRGTFAFYDDGTRTFETSYVILDNRMQN